MSNFHPSLYLDELQKDVHSYAVRHGFWDHDDSMHCVDSEKIALMHSELSEALEALRYGHMVGRESVEHELADCVIRILDYCEARNLSLRRGIITAKDKCKGRGYLHGKTNF